jgi:hypothetical protein
MILLAVRVGLGSVAVVPDSEEGRAIVAVAMFPTAVVETAAGDVGLEMLTLIMSSRSVLSDTRDAIVDVWLNDRPKCGALAVFGADMSSIVASDLRDA